MNVLWRWWKTGVASAALLLILLISISTRNAQGPVHPGNPWDWVLPYRGAPQPGLLCYVNLMRLRTAAPALLAAGSRFFSFTPSLAWQAVTGTSEVATLEELFVGVRLRGEGYPTGQLGAVLQGAFSREALYKALVGDNAISFTREVGGFTVHRLRSSSSVPPELVFVDERHLLLCDAQSTAEILEHRHPAPPSDLEDCLLWADGYLRRVHAPALLPETIEGARFTLLVKNVRRRLAVLIRIQPSGSPEELAAFFDDHVHRQQIFTTGSGVGRKGLRLDLEHTETEVVVRCVVEESGLERLLGELSGG